MSNCLKKCCCPKKDKEQEPLTLGGQCVVPAGIYKNVDVEINEECRIVRLAPADNREVFLCDPCNGGNDE